MNKPNVRFESIRVMLVNSLVSIYQSTRQCFIKDYNLKETCFSYTISKKEAKKTELHNPNAVIVTCQSHVYIVREYYDYKSIFILTLKMWNAVTI